MTLSTLVLALGLATGAGPVRETADYSAYGGDYQVAPDHVIGIDPFIDDAGEKVLLFSDYQSGVVRRLFPASGTEFVMGPGFEVSSPTELEVRFETDSKGNVTGASLEPAGGTASLAKRVRVDERAVTIANGPVRLAGTLLVPATKGPHPAIVLLHGSGPLTRYSFGPYPHFFTSLGFAVLIYDKRGTGGSTGTRLDASTGSLTSLPAAYYPDDLLSDARTALSFLRQQPGIDPKQVGVWGSSEGGMLAIEVAAHEKSLAFAIDSSGFMGPLSHTILYQQALVLKGYGTPAPDIEEAQKFTTLWMKVARTGEDYDVFIRERDAARRDMKPWKFSWLSSEFSSLEQMRWDWDHILSFTPVPALQKVTCPVLALYGDSDQLNDVRQATDNLRDGLAHSGSRDFTVKVFPSASHSLMEVPSGNRMAPGVFDTLRSWLRQRVGSTASQN